MGKTEEWRMIPGYEPYEASNLGKIRRKHKIGYVILKPWHNQYGHEIVDMKLKTGRKVSYVHRLVAMAFIEKVNGKDFINHIDNNPHNNKPENLQWCTKKENSVWMSKQNRGTGKPVIAYSLSGNEVLYFSNMQQARRKGFQPSCIVSCCKEIRKQHKGYRWEYGEEIKKRVHE